MQSHKKYIALLLLLGFLFPQAANSAHYFLVSHADHKDLRFSADVKVPGFEFHSCDYKLSSIKFLIPEAGFLTLDIPDISSEENFKYKPGYFTIYNYNYSLRGPPV